MGIQFADKGVELMDRHDGHSFKNQNFLFNEGDDNRDRFLIRDTFIKQWSFLCVVQ